MSSHATQTEISTQQAIAPPKTKINMKNICNYNFTKIGCWNIHGAYDKTNSFRINKLEDPCFLKILEAHDILCVQETHCGQNDLSSDHLTQFDSIPHCRKKSSNNRFFGGMLLLIRKSVRRGVKVTNSTVPDILGITLSKEFFGRSSCMVCQCSSFELIICEK